MEVFILAYQIQPIRDIIGNSVVSMYMYSQLIPEPCYVWTTGEENEIVKYMSLLDSALEMERVCSTFMKTPFAGPYISDLFYSQS